MLATSERLLQAKGTFRAILASENHWLQQVSVLSVHWWPTPTGVGRVLVSCGKVLMTYACSTFKLINCLGFKMHQSCWLNCFEVRAGILTTIYTPYVWYSLTSFIRQPRYYDTFLRNQTFQSKTASFVWLRHAIMQHFKSLFRHIKEVVTANIPFIYVRVKLSYER